MLGVSNDVLPDSQSFEFRVWSPVLKVSPSVNYKPVNRCRSFKLAGYHSYKHRGTQEELTRTMGSGYLHYHNGGGGGGFLVLVNPSSNHRIFVKHAVQLTDCPQIWQN